MTTDDLQVPSRYARPGRVPTYAPPAIAPYRRGEGAAEPVTRSRRKPPRPAKKDRGGLAAAVLDALAQAGADGMTSEALR